MSPALTSVCLAILATLALAGLASQTFLLKRAYYAGVTLWSQWLPVVATGVYLAVLGLNLTGNGRALGLGGAFTSFEIAVLLGAGPFFLTRIGSLVATATVIYCLEQMLLYPLAGHTAANGLLLITSAATLVAVLGDMMPWVALQGGRPVARILRRLLLAAITLGAMAVIFTCLVKAHGFSRWIASTLGTPFPKVWAISLLIFMFMGWATIALGFTRQMTIPLLSLPTLLVLAFVTGWPSHLLVVPFTVAVALSLASAERRGFGRRRSVNSQMTMVISR